jgi:hypothetical protein
VGAPRKSRHQKRIDRERSERQKASGGARQSPVVNVLLHVPPHQPPTPPTESWWTWSKGEVIAVLALIVALIGVIATVKSQGNTPSQLPKQNPSVVPAPKTPEGDPPTVREPHIQYVPLPHGDPFRKPGTLVTLEPPEGEESQTVSINGEKVPVMTQKDLENMLSQKVSASKFVKTSNDVDLWISVGKDGGVEQVQGLPSDGMVSNELKHAVKLWRFKPFFRDGKNVAVQTVIQLKGVKTEKP